MKRFVFHPDQPEERQYRQFRPKKENWFAPEHERILLEMEKDWPRDKDGIRIAGASKEYVIDKRPNIMRPLRPLRFVAL